MKQKNGWEMLSSRLAEWNLPTVYLGQSYMTYGFPQISQVAYQITGDIYGSN